MKKNTIIVLLTILSAGSLSFAIYEKQRADDAVDQAFQNEAIARDAEQRAAAAMMDAQMQAKQARESLMIAQEQTRIAIEEATRRRK